MIERYADYEAIEMSKPKASDKNLWPYYLPKDEPTGVCPICLAVADVKKLVYYVEAPRSTISFIKYLDFEIDNHGRDFKVYFHNLKYDFRIILHELFYANFTQSLSGVLRYDTVIPKKDDRHFTILGESTSNFIGVDIYYRGVEIQLRDTYKVITSSQDKILNDFGYAAKVEVNWQDITIDNVHKHMSLIKRRNIYDVTSLAKAITEFKDRLYGEYKGKGDTAASISLSALKHFLGKTTYKELFPRLSDEARKLSAGCYTGGLCTVNQKYMGKLINNIYGIDINSSYPFAMTKPLPYGDPWASKNIVKGEYGEYIVHINFEARGIPFIRCHTENYARSIIDKPLLAIDKTYTKTKLPQRFEGYLCLNSLDIEAIKKYCDLKDFEIITGYNYTTKPHLKDYIENLYKEKENAVGVKKGAIKLLLNSLYGKFAQDLSGIARIYTSPDEYYKINVVDENPLYRPVSAAITAYARQRWLEMVYFLGDDFVYGDTDSAYFLNAKKYVDTEFFKSEIHHSRLGAWGFEDYGPTGADSGKFLSKKNYMMIIKGKQKLTCVGLPHRYHHLINMNNFFLGSNEIVCDKMVNIYGGQAMKKTVFTIRERSL